MKNAVLDIVDINYLDSSNSRFYKKGDFIFAELITRAEGEEPVTEDKGMVTLRRMFPFDEKYTMISVLSAGEEEIGIIRNADDLESAELIKEELDRVYFMPRILSIRSMKERFGYSTWRVTTDKGELSFTLNDVYKSMIKLGKRIIVSDVDGNRYEIEDTSLLDKRSYRKIELYL